MGVSYSTGPTPDSSPGASVALKSPMLSSTKGGSELLRAVRWVRRSFSIWLFGGDLGKALKQPGVTESI